MTIPFDKSELKIVEEIPNPYGKTPMRMYATPVTAREAVKSLFQRKPVWQCSGMGVEYHSFCPALNPDNIARGMVMDATARKDKAGQAGGLDMFGVLWEYEPEVGGSMVRPESVPYEDMDGLMENLKWPDLDSWDWEGSAKANANYFREDRFNICWFMNGWYERLISLLGFESAAMALIDEEQQETVHAFLDKLSGLYIDLIGRYLKYFPMIDGFYIHDDWGGQLDTFFSPDVAEEMLVPYMRRITDFIHSQGRYCDLHSCGQNFKQVPNYIKAGWDSWRPQAMNDVAKIYDLYGDKIIIAVPPKPFDPETATLEEQRQAARAYAEKFCDPDKPSMFSLYGTPMMTPAFQEELYIQARRRYAREI